MRLSPSRPCMVGLLLLCLLLWSYWTTLVEMAERWTDDPQYSHGYLVPLFSLYLLWSRRLLLNSAKLSPSWWGIVVLLAGLGARAVGVYYFYGYFDGISLLLCLAGLALTVGGPQALRWSWLSIAFLAFMIPLPYRLQGALGGRLQRIATDASTYLLQTCGAPAVAEGNIILINDVRMGVVEACNGLGMLVTFVAISTAIAILLKHGWWRRAAVIAGAAPVAVIANVIRITVTGLLYSASKNETAQIVFHDIAGWLMMPLAVLIVFLELHVLDRLIVERKATDRGPVSFIAEKTPQTVS
jgi:exosortase